MSVRVADKSKIARKRDGAKSERLKPTQAAGQDRPTAERQLTRKRDDAKPWV